MDSPTTFFYLDPPYVNARQGHYSGYTQEDFDNLINILKSIKGKFLLSSYDNNSIYNPKWTNEKISMALGVHAVSRKIEVLTYNYELNTQSSLW